MLVGENGPPATPLEESASEGLTTICIAEPGTVRTMGRVVLPNPFVVFAKATTSAYCPGASGLAPGLSVTVTGVLAPPLSVPPDDESDVQNCDLVADQLMAAVPGLFS